MPPPAVPKTVQWAQGARLLTALAFGPLLAGCGSQVSAHLIDVVVDDQSVVTHGVLAFPDACGTLGGECPESTHAYAIVSGDTPVVGARMETGGDGSSRIYDLTMRGDPDGPVHGTCRFYYFTDDFNDRPAEGDFGEPNEGGFVGERAVTVTLKFRDGDDGS